MLETSANFTYIMLLFFPLLFVSYTVRFGTIIETEKNYFFLLTYGCMVVLVC